MAEDLSKEKLRQAFHNTGSKFRGVANRMRATDAGASHIADCWLLFGAVLSESIADVAAALVMDLDAQLKEMAEREARIKEAVNEVAVHHSVGDLPEPPGRNGGHQVADVAD